MSLAAGRKLGAKKLQDDSLLRPIATLAKGVSILLVVGTFTLKVADQSRTTEDAAWAAVTTLTGAGFGDVVLSTALERCVACCLACCGVALLGALASAVVATWSRRPNVRRQVSWPAAVCCHLLCGALAISIADHMRLADALYLSIMTATGVGPGDVVPKSTSGRLTTAIFSMASSLVFARLVGAIALVPLERWRRRILDTFGTVLTADTLAQLARGRRVKQLGLSRSDGYVTRDEFTLLALIEQCLVSVQDIEIARAKFDQLDRDGTGRLHQADLDILELDRQTALDFFEVNRPRLKRPPSSLPPPRRQALI